METKNKILLSEKRQREKREKEKQRRSEREERKREAKEAELEGNPKEKKIPKTTDNSKLISGVVDDEEGWEDVRTDEFASHFVGGRTPKVIITSSYSPSKKSHDFINELKRLIPNSEYYERRNYELKEICEYGKNRGFTAVIVVNENSRRLNGLWITALPDGPTAHFKLTSTKLPKEIDGHGRTTDHEPELICSGFTTHLGHSVGRMLCSLFPVRANFHGRRVVTFHNQRDFIFIRHHRYIFENQQRVRLQELGPRFTLKLQSLQKGSFDSTTGNYYFMHKPELDDSRKRFFL